MKKITKKSGYAILLAFCGVFAIVIFSFARSKTQLPKLKERNGALAKAPEWQKTQEDYKVLETAIMKNPNDNKELLKLTKLFIQEGRASGDFSYYNKSSLDILSTVLEKDPSNFEALCFQSMVMLSQHRFVEAKQIAEKARTINQHNSYIYGLMIDASVELGDYKEAVTLADKMVTLRPDIRSYSRVSYLREIHGDLPGAIDAIKMAIAAGVPGYEDTEWARLVLAHLYEDSNQLEMAKKTYQTALSYRPNYPFATAGLGKIARFEKNYPQAIAYYEQAKKDMADASFFTELIDLYKLTNQADKAEENAKALLNSLTSDQSKLAKKSNEGHNANRELALTYLQLGENKKALEYATTEYELRPDNIDVCETLAWAYYQNKEYAKALSIAQKGLKTNSQNPERLVQTGLIMWENNKSPEATALIKKGLEAKPYMDEAIATSANKIIVAL
ncbi:MAG: tetratricopeptide repeat protein [Saprospiraceae bacterium]